MTSLHSRVPQQVTALELATISTAACGSTHTAVLAHDGAVYLFGSNSFGQLGIANADAQEFRSKPRKLRLEAVARPIPTMPLSSNPVLLTQISSAPKFVRMACGLNYSTALTDTGLVSAWGYVCLSYTLILSLSLSCADGFRLYACEHVSGVS